MLSTVFLIVGLLLVPLVFLWIVYRQKKQVVHAFEKIKLQLADHQLLIEHMPHFFCYWYEGSSFATCSQALRRLLLLPDREWIQIDQLLQKLGAEIFSPLERSLTHIREHGGEFETQISILDDDVHLVAKGRSLHLNSSTFQSNLIILSFTYPQENIQVKRNQIDIWHAIVDALPMVVWLRNEHSRITHCNKSYGDLLDKTPGRIVSDNQELVNPSSQFEGTYGLHQRIQSTHEPVSVRTHIIDRGERRWFELGERMIKIADHDYFLGYGLDITEIQEKDEEIQCMVRAQHDLIEPLSTGVCIYGPDYRLVTYNSAYRKIFNFDEQWLSTRPMLGDVLEHLREKRKLPEYSDFPEYKRSRMDLFHTMFTPIHDTLHQANGCTLRMVIAPHPMGGIFYLFDDVTQTINLDHTHQKLNAAYYAVLDQMPYALILFGSDHRVILSNPAFANRFHQEPKVGDHITNVLKAVSPNEDWIQLAQTHINERKASSHLANDLPFSYTPLPDGSDVMWFYQN